MGASFSMQSHAIETETSFDEARLEAAQRYMDAINYENQVKETMATSAPQFIEVGLANAEQIYETKLPDDVRNEIKKAMLKVIDEIGDQFSTKTRLRAARTFAANFTAAELDRLTEIQSDPVMKKFLSKSPQISSELFNIGITEMQVFQPLIQQKVQEIVQAYLDENSLETS